jgi:hypothetical protein
MDSFPSRNPRILVLIGGVFLVALVVIFAFVSAMNRNRATDPGTATTQGGPTVTPFDSQSRPEDTNPSPGSANVKLGGESPVPGAIAKVGDEFLYEEDLNYELTFYPAENDGDVQRLLLDKMIEDSLILQGARDEGLVELDRTIFNSPDKDYVKRIETVLDLRDRIDEKATVLEGTVLAIWFHNSVPAPMGYDQGKTVAMEEMTKIQREMKAGTLTAAAAAARIRANAALAQVDPSYRANASFDFAVSDNQKITYSKDVDARIYRLNQGDVSEIIVGKDLDPRSGRQIDAVYMVAQVTKRGTSDITSFESWIDRKSKQYETIRY